MTVEVKSDHSSAIQSALITLQSDMAVTRLELSQVRADIKLLQPSSDVEFNGNDGMDGAAEDAKGTEESADAEDVSSDSV
ncbi:hypothetical protein CJ030_MR5G025053 [Morella rubra]|uniref:Uncharacterized protein n=1 Tax=Morella rubra TaxID=262757 RepID=A0A6A1VI87_9ROSI|nr:hypothetical protein CJ030_MR5G025053 [Morella rubra]